MRAGLTITAALIVPFAALVTAPLALCQPLTAATTFRVDEMEAKPDISTGRGTGGNVAVSKFESLMAEGYSYLRIGQDTKAIEAYVKAIDEAGNHEEERNAIEKLEGVDVEKDSALAWLLAYLDAGLKQLSPVIVVALFIGSLWLLALLYGRARRKWCRPSIAIRSEVKAIPASVLAGMLEDTQRRFHLELERQSRIAEGLNQTGEGLSLQINPVPAPAILVSPTMDFSILKDSGRLTIESGWEKYFVSLLPNTANRAAALIHIELQQAVAATCQTLSASIRVFKGSYGTTSVEGDRALWRTRTGSDAIKTLEDLAVDIVAAIEVLLSDEPGERGQNDGT